jgi:hypothetical protein
MIWPMPSPTRSAAGRRRADGARGGPTRRVVLGAGLLAVALGASSCGVRLEDDAPRLPLVPTREPIAGEDALLRLLDQTGRLASWAEALGRAGKPSAVATQLAPVHRQQAARLAAGLRARGVPEHLVSVAQPGHRLEAATAPATPKALGSLEAAAIQPPAARAVLSADRYLFAMVGALLAQRSAAAQLLGARVPPDTSAWPSPQLAVGPLTSVRAAVYGFEVVAAHAADGTPVGAQDPLKATSPERSRAQATLGVLRSLQTRLETLTGPQAPPAELGYTLPYPVDSAASARRLARSLLGRLLATLAASLDPSAAGREAAPQLLRWIGTVEVEQRRWGGSLTAFPGLS